MYITTSDDKNMRKTEEFDERFIPRFTLISARINRTTIKVERGIFYGKNAE